MYLTPRIFSPYHHGLLSSNIQREAFSSGARPMTAHSQGDEINVFEESHATRKKELPEMQGNRLFEQEAQEPFQDQGVGGIQGSCMNEEL